MDLKELKKLVAYCRSVGISHYESNDVKFDLTSYDPKVEKKVAKKIVKAEKTAEDRIAELSEEDLLLYSSASFSDKEV